MLLPLPGPKPYKPSAPVPSTNTKSTPFHKPPKFSLKPKPSFEIPNPQHQSDFEFHRNPKSPNRTPKNHVEFVLQTTHPKTRENTPSSSQGLLHTHGITKSREPSGGQATASRGHVYARDAPSEDADPRAAAAGQSERAVGGYKWRATNQRRFVKPLRVGVSARLRHTHTESESGVSDLFGF